MKNLKVRSNSKPDLGDGTLTEPPIAGIGEMELVAKSAGETKIQIE
jgi:hypothetical protein